MAKLHPINQYQLGFSGLNFWPFAVFNSC